MFLYTSIFQDCSGGRVVKNSVDTAKQGAQTTYRKKNLASLHLLVSSHNYILVEEKRHVASCA